MYEQKIIEQIFSLCFFYTLGELTVLSRQFAAGLIDFLIARCKVATANVLYIPLLQFTQDIFSVWAG
jgi:hypothetical protein